MPSCLQVGEQLQLQGVSDFLDSEQGQAEVIAEDTAAKQRRVGGVPHFTIRAEGQDEGYVLKGAQGVDGSLAAFASIVGKSS